MIQKRCGVCLNYKENLSHRQWDISCFPQCLLCEVKLQNKVGYFIVMCRSSSKIANELNNFHLHLNQLLNQMNKFHSSFILCDFNARLELWQGFPQRESSLQPNFIDFPHVMGFPPLGIPAVYKSMPPLHLSETPPSLGCLLLYHSMQRGINFLLENYPLVIGQPPLENKNFLTTP